MHPDLDTRLFIGGGTANTGGAFVEIRSDNNRAGWTLFDWLSLPGVTLATGPQAHLFFVGV